MYSYNPNILSTVYTLSGYFSTKLKISEAPLTKQNDETEDQYNERIMDAARDIESLYNYLLDRDFPSELSFQDKQKELDYIYAIQQEYERVFGFFPSADNIFERYTSDHPNADISLSELAKNAHKVKLAQPVIKQKNTKNETALRQWLRMQLTANSKLSTSDIWQTLSNHQGDELADLIEIIKVDGDTPKSRLRWQGMYSDTEGRAITKQNLGKAISEIKKSLKK